MVLRAYRRTGQTQTEDRKRTETSNQARNTHKKKICTMSHGDLCMYVCIYACMHVCIYARMCKYDWTYTNVFVFVLFLSDVSAYMSYIHTYMYTCIHQYSCCKLHSTQLQKRLTKQEECLTKPELHVTSKRPHTDVYHD
jgi:hypothetical protein